MPPRPIRRLPPIARRPGLWFAAFAGWCATLVWLSSGPLPEIAGPEIPFFDKVAHFGWFFGGAGLLSAFLFLRRPALPPRAGQALAVVLALAAIGAADEWRQSHVEGRTGNDLGDWAADVLGSVAGVLVFRRAARVFGPTANGGRHFPCPTAAECE